MNDGPELDPIVEQPVTAPSEAGHPTRRRLGKEDWVVVDRVKGQGAKSRLQSQHRELEQAGIDARIEHDSEGRLVLEVPAPDEHKAVKILGKKNVHGVGENPHATSEERIEAEERSAAKGVFNPLLLAIVGALVAVAFLVWFLSLSR